MHSILVAFWNEVQKMSWMEAVAAFTGLISVILAVRNNIWTWPWGIVSVILYAIVFRDYKYYANAGLQVFCFLPLSIYGWWAWLRCGPNRDDDLPILPLSSKARWIWAGITLVLSIILVHAMRTPAWADPSPAADGITTAFSIVAQCLQSRKIIENWALWIAADVIYAFYLFPHSNPPLYFSTALYVIFLGLAIAGWRAWLRIMRIKYFPDAPQLQEGVTQAHD